MVTGRSRSGSRGRSTVFLLTLALVVGLSAAWWQTFTWLPTQVGCVATAGEVEVELATDQAANAAIIAAIGVRRNLPARAVSIALATAYQESKIRNLNYGDRDSLGIFQQRPSQGWGTPAQVQDPVYATGKFYDTLVKLPDYEAMRITEAAQWVQRSAFPEAYERHAPNARVLASALTGYSGDGAFTCVVAAPTQAARPGEVRRTLQKYFGRLDMERTGVRQDLVVHLERSEAGRRLGRAIGAFLVAHASELKLRQVSFAGLRWQAGPPSADGWQPAPSETTDSGTSDTLVIGLG